MSVGWSRESVFERIVDIAADVADVDRKTITASTRLNADLHLDDLALLEVLILGEEIFDVSISTDDLPSGSGAGASARTEATIGEVVAAIRSALDTPPRPVPPSAPRKRRFRRRL